jgi:phytoene synthase
MADVKPLHCEATNGDDTQMDSSYPVEQGAAAPGSSLHYSLLGLPAQQRQAVSALFALRDEALAIVRQIDEPQVRSAKTLWWREELERLSRHCPQHPLTRVLNELESSNRIDLHDIVRLFDAIDRYNRSPTFETETALTDFCRDITGTIMTLAGEFMNTGAARLNYYAQNLGIALQLTLHISEMGADLQRERLFVPLEDLNRCDVDPSVLLARQHDAHIARLVALQIDRAMAYYTRAMEALPAEQRYTQTAGIVLSNINTTLLEEIRKDQYRVTQHRIALTPLRKLWIAWRTRRREHRQQQQLQKNAQ